MVLGVVAAHFVSRLSQCCVLPKLPVGCGVDYGVERRVGVSKCQGPKVHRKWEFVCPVSQLQQGNSRGVVKT